MPKYPTRPASNLPARPLPPVRKLPTPKPQPKKEAPPRLPDGSSYLTTYDATTRQWGGVLLAGTPERMAAFKAALDELIHRHVEAGNGDVVRAANSHANLFGLLTKMDANYRK